MAVSAVSGTGVAQPAKTGFSAMTSEDFTKLIFMELSKQDPTQPSDTNQLLQQLSQIRSIQSDTDLSSRLSALVNQNEFSNASALIGRMISGVSEDNERVAGLVNAVTRTNQGTFVTLGTGVRVNISNVDEIQQVNTTAAAPVDTTGEAP